MIKQICLFLNFLLITVVVYTQPPFKQFLLLPKKDSLQTHQPIPLAKDYYVQQLGFVCKQELKIEKAIKIPLRIRLGSLDYCNKLEGKK